MHENSLKYIKYSCVIFIQSTEKSVCSICIPDLISASLEKLLEAGGTAKDIAFLAVSGVAVILSLLKIHPFPFDMAWIAIILCGLPIVLEAIIGLIIGILVLAAGIYYLAKEKNDAESKKIYAIASAVGGIIAVVCVILLIVK